MDVDAARQGIEPVPPPLRRLGALDNAVLWGSLSVGLLVLVTGGFLVPALGLAEALAAIAVGSALGGLLLGAIAWLAARSAVPGMVLLRAPLGVRGSVVPTALNVLQTLGWTTFEIIVIASAARAAVGGPLELWTVLAALAVVGLALGGPLVVVRRVLRLVGVPVTVAAGVYLTWWAATRLSWDDARTGEGGMPFWLAVDLSLAIPVSWAPLVADYARFSRSPGGAFAGTAAGCALANAWFLALGAILVLVGAADHDHGVTAAAGALVLGLLALAEADKPFADLYSAVVSIQNVRPRWPVPALAVGLGAAVLVAALVVPLRRYEAFLFLLGSCFVPLAGVLLAHALRSRRYRTEELYRRDGAFGAWNGGAFVAWAAGFALYQWIAPTPVEAWRDGLDAVLDAVGIGFAPDRLAQLGGSVPSFVVAAALTAVLARRPSARPEPAAGQAVPAMARR